MSAASRTSNPVHVSKPKSAATDPRRARGGTLYAFEDRCTHDDSPFEDAAIEDCEIICPRHGARFSLESGEVLTPPAYEPLRVFEVRESSGRVEVLG